MNSNIPIIAITGQAGTGKTTLIRHIAGRLHDQAYRVAAPTGKAAKRIQEATGVRAITIHKLLEYGRPRLRDKKTGQPVSPTSPRRDREYPIDEKIILVDEYSMVNHELNRNLIDALPRGGRIIMFGDVSQLPPIEPYPLKNVDGSPFETYLRGGKNIQTFTLEQVYRQQENSDVLLAATAIRRGNVPRRGDSFQILMSDEPVKRLNRLLDDSDINYGKLDNQILTPVRGKWIGTNALNVILKNRYNPHGRDSVSLMRYEWDEDKHVTISVGDKVVCTENTYDMRNYTERFESFNPDGKADYDTFIPTPETKYMLNGETGIVTEIYPDSTFEVDFGDRTVEIPYKHEEWHDRAGVFYETYPQRAIDLAYALTTHKAQGSEYEHVIYVINDAVAYMLSRNNMYTAVTRARKSVNLIANARSLTLSLRITNDVINKRNAARANMRTGKILTDKAKKGMVRK